MRDPFSFSLRVFQWAFITTILFIPGWALGSFVMWDWDLPLISWGSRLWLIVCARRSLAAVIADRARDRNPV